MRFQNICLEGPDCSGKTTIFNSLHKKTNFRYNINDRGLLSMFVYAKMNSRPEASQWFDMLWSNLKSLDTLYVVIVPDINILQKRLQKRGDEFQDSESIVSLRQHFFNTVKFNLCLLPNVLLLEEEGIEKNVDLILRKLNKINTASASDLIKDLVLYSGQNELIDIRCKEYVDRGTLDYSVLDFEEEKQYYIEIEEKIKQKIFKEFRGLNKSNIPQKHNSRRFIYSDDSCISMIHVMFRQDKLNISAVLRSSNVIRTLRFDLEFLKILSCRIADELQLSDKQIELTVNIRSAHIVP